MKSKSYIFSILSLTFLTLLGAYPNIPSEKGREILYSIIHSLFLLRRGEIFWLDNLASGLGFTSVGQEIGIVSFLSAIHLMSNISLSNSIIILCSFLKLQLVFVGFCVSKHLKLRNYFFLPIVILTSFYVIRHTEWVLSSRFLTIVFTFNILLVFFFIFV